MREKDQNLHEQPKNKETIIGQTGVVAGKFYPPHRGHKHLIDTASSQVNHLTVIVSDKKEYAIPGELRAQWLREIHPDATVMVIDQHTLPERDSRAWAEHTIKWLGYAPEVVFSSEDYGDTWAQELGAKHVKVDPNRLHTPISGTMIRENPMKYLDFLEPCVRDYFTRGVVFERRPN